MDYVSGFTILDNDYYVSHDGEDSSSKSVE